jgi:hypothetical protein
MGWDGTRRVRRAAAQQRHAWERQTTPRQLRGTSLEGSGTLPHETRPSTEFHTHDSTLLQRHLAEPDIRPQSVCTVSTRKHITALECFHTGNRKRTHLQGASRQGASTPPLRCEPPRDPIHVQIKIRWCPLDAACTRGKYACDSLIYEKTDTIYLATPN